MIARSGEILSFISLSVHSITDGSVLNNSQQLSIEYFQFNYPIKNIDKLSHYYLQFVIQF